MPFQIVLGVLCSAAVIGLGESAASLHSAVRHHADITSSVLEVEEDVGPPLITNEEKPDDDNTDKTKKAVKLYKFEMDNFNFEPPYENSVNPFLSHIEQSAKLKPVRNRYIRRKLLQSGALSPQQQKKLDSSSSINSYADELFGPLPVDPKKAHFMESGEADDTDDKHNFGDEEKNLRRMIRTLISPDY